MRKEVRSVKRMLFYLVLTKRKRVGAKAQFYESKRDIETNPTQQIKANKSTNLKRANELYNSDTLK